MFSKTFQFKVTYEREVLRGIINGIITLLTVALTRNRFPGLIKTDSYRNILKRRSDYNRAWLIETDWSHVNLPLHICSPIPLSIHQIVQYIAMQDSCKG